MSRDMGHCSLLKEPEDERAAEPEAEREVADCGICFLVWINL